MDFVRRSVSRLNRRRSRRTERTPYYMVGLPAAVYRLTKSLRDDFISAHGRDYEGDDEQFVFESDELRAAWLADTAQAMRESNHHAAHVYAFERTGKIIHDQNFRDVPDEWTLEWQKATQDWEKWSPDNADRSSIRFHHDPRGIGEELKKKR